MASDGKKKRKQKGKTVALTEFLGNETPAAFVSFSTSHSSWAEETEDVNPDCNSPNHRLLNESYLNAIRCRSTQ
jgi:hypothetical protein